ncbi:MAG: ABC transporter permease [Gracilibacteraceae bacterium]|jgi:putative ABC transport system permease protein|nr:ABC transporter permease [Gracilibacteraceae bacterium]
MPYLNKKLRKDFWTFRNQFFAVFLMAMLGVFIYTGLEGVWRGMQDSADKWFAASNSADAWISGLNINNEEVEKIKALPSVTEAQASALLTTKVAGADAYLLLAASPENLISLPYTADGSDYSPNAEGIWLYREVAEAHSLAVGKTVTIENRGIVLIFEIRGLILSPDYLRYAGSSMSVKPDRYKYGYGLISPANMEIVIGGDLTYNQIRIKYKDSPTTTKQNIEQILGAKYAGFVTPTEFKGTLAFLERYGQIRALSILFSMIFVLLALLTIQTTIKRLIETQRIQVGTFKALGYSNATLLRHYSLFGLLISAAGCLLGYLLAPKITIIMLEIHKNLFSLPEWTGKNTPASLVIAALITLACSISARQACRKVIKEMPATTMRAEPPKNHKPIFLERLPLWPSLSYGWQWVLRDFSRDKTRFLLGIIGVIGSIVLLIASFGLRDSLTTTNANMYGHQFDYGAKITLNPLATDEQREELYALADQDAQWMIESEIEINKDARETLGALVVLERGDYVHVKDTKGKLVTLPDDGVAISRKLAEELGVNLNDTLQFKYSPPRAIGSPITDPGAVITKTTITAVVREIVTPPAPQGLYLTRTYWETLSFAFMPNTLLTQKSTIADQAQDLPYVIEAVKLDQQLADANDIVSSIIVVIVMMLAAAILLSVIIQYNLGLLSFTERSREYATLKVIGYKKAEIKSIIRKRSQLQVFVGLILGIPIGYRFLGFYTSLVSTPMIEFTPHLKPQNLVISLLIVILCSYSVTSFVAKKTETLDMVSTLKSVE